MADDRDRHRFRNMPWGAPFIGRHLLIGALYMPPALLPRARAVPEGGAGKLAALLVALGLTRLRRRKVGEPGHGRRDGRSARTGREGGSKSGRSPTGSEVERTKVTERDRGRAATTPSEIPAKGWKDILWRVYQEFSKDRVLSVPRDRGLRIALWPCRGREYDQSAPRHAVRFPSGWGNGDYRRAGQERRV